MANSYLTHTTSAPTNDKIMTFSFWLKKGKEQEPIMSRHIDSNNRFQFYNLDGTGGLQLYQQVSGSVEMNLTHDRQLRDFSAWYHFVIAIDTTQVTAADRVKIYINGELLSGYSTATYPAQDADILFNGTSVVQEIGRTNASDYYNGYISHFAFVDGTALTPTSFGETDSTSGIWKFKSPSGLSWGNNGFHLKFENSGALGTDSSGQTNNFTVNGNLKQSLDTPSNVHATFNPIDKGKAGTMNFANGNTTTMNTSGFGDYGVRTNLGVTKGKWYWEIKIGSNSSANAFAILPMEDTLKFDMFGSSPEAHLYGLQMQTSSATNFYNNTTFISGNTAWGGGITSSDVVGFALDMDNGKLYISKNGTFKDMSGNTSNIGSGTYPTFTIANTSFTYTLYVEMRTNDDNGLHINMGDGFFGTTAISSAGSNGNGSLFEYDVPSGFYALNTKNLNTYG